jgi:hypothetical protein
MVVIGIWQVNDDERTIWIEQAGIIRPVRFVRSRFLNAHLLLSSGKHRITLSQGPSRRE